ncbi:MAG: 2-aminoethylphosphonate--pyruvate transaminase [Candidatus Scalindua brodae]|uniref:2-aminoethylphosphonate--pyruvate transaminase n=1 Tax=Candidatus Scalindua brodae TaxID=237368 RepID=A0A0B0EHS5_9BACT|nr:MAG: 2-aminoethylphosphonate--pyruvate transaminase [Candidatus Scalindua brodae]
MEKMILLNPGPVCTSDRVRSSLMKGDMCHRESEFSAILSNTRKKILQLLRQTEITRLQSLPAPALLHWKPVSALQ